MYNGFVIFALINNIYYHEIFNFFIFSLLLSSCTVYMPVTACNNHVPKESHASYTHSDHMSQFKTKKDVVKSFGIATQKENIEGLEIWYYDKGITTTENYI